MTEQQQGDVQDPAEPYETGTQTETSDQPESPSDVQTGGELDHSDSEAPLETGGELNHTEEPAPVEVSPSTVPDDTKTTTIHGNKYEVTPDGGHRRV